MTTLILKHLKEYNIINKNKNIREIKNMATYYKYLGKWNSNKELREWEKRELELHLFNTEEAMHLLYQGKYHLAILTAERYSGLYDIPKYIYNNIVKELKEDEELQETIKNYKNELAPRRR